jgi:hypothetical protein
MQLADPALAHSNQGQPSIGGCSVPDPPVIHTACPGRPPSLAEPPDIVLPNGVTSHQ